MLVAEYDGAELIGGQLEGAIIVKFDPEELDPNLYQQIYSYLVGNFYTTPKRFERAVKIVRGGLIGVAPNPYDYECVYLFKAIGSKGNIYDVELNMCLEEPRGYCQCWDFKCMEIFRRTGRIRGGCSYLRKHLEAIPPEYRYRLFMCKHLVASYIVYMYGFADFVTLSDILFMAEEGVSP